MYAKDIQERFWDRLVIQENGCWLWPGATNPDGSGVITFNGKTLRTNRLAWLLSNGEIPEGYVVSPVICKDILCCNPEHLQLLTKKGYTHKDRIKHDINSRIGPKTGYLADIKDVFWNRMQENEYGCWVWTGAVNNNGAGRIRYKRKDRTTHYLAFELTKLNGEQVPDGFGVWQTCCNRLCCNPDHLELITVGEMLNRAKNLEAKDE